MNPEQPQKNPVPDNLKDHTFKPGQSGNPAGRPPGILNVKTVLEKWLNAEEIAVNPITRQSETLTQMDIMVLQQLKKARNDGDTQAFNALLDRYFGKPTQPISGAGGGPLKIRIRKTHKSNDDTDAGV